jgi:hypothetical protein
MYIYPDGRTERGKLICLLQVLIFKIYKFNLYMSYKNISPNGIGIDKSHGKHINLPLSVRPSGYIYMVCSAISSYSFEATALIFCRMFIHIMEVCMSTGF